MPRQRVQLLAAGIGLVPALLLVYRTLTDALGPNPVEDLTHATGIWALRLLLACLAVTPLRQLFGWPGLAPFRRTLGLLAFFYACLHVTLYGVLDRELDLALVAEDVTERPYILAGLASLLCLVPLAVTSTRAWIRRLGRRWTRLHRLVYAAAAAAVIHFLWLVKADLREPLIYAAVLGALLAARVARAAIRARRARPHAA